jgi:transcriptional regulator with XRE-family HTH domain
MVAVAETVLDVAKVRQLRLERGLTMDAAAKAAGFSTRQNWYMIESGRSGTDVSVSTLGRLARALDCSPDDLLTTPED